MFENYLKKFSWDFYSRFIIIIYSLLQIMRWRILPQFMDIYYHLLTAWGFIQAGGYSGWDFWQYAPFGRPHIYPPVFHIMLAFLIKLGISKIILAKFFEAAIPVLFLIVIWRFIRNNYSQRLAFFVMIASSSSNSFYMSLLNHIPATLAIIFGILAFEQLLKNKFIRCVLLLSLCFYTHIGVSWLFAFSVVFYGLSNKPERRFCLNIFISAIILSLPMLLKQLAGLKFISVLGLNLHEKYLCQFKIFDYALALLGLIIVSKRGKKYRLFLSLFLASPILLIYPYRFFSAEGYLPIIFLSAVSLNSIWEKFKYKKTCLKNTVVLLVFFILFVSPTLSMEKPESGGSISYKIYIPDSAFMNLLFPADLNRRASFSMWLPKEYLSAAAFIKQNSQKTDIIYSSFYILGVCLASISERATANGLFREISNTKGSDPFLASKIFIATQDDDPVWLSNAVNKYGLMKMGENKIFIFYDNLLSNTKIDIRKASVPFWMIGIIGFVFMVLYFVA